MSNFQNIHNSLDRVKQNSKTIDLDVQKSKVIIFSDHHRGRKDGADDFLNSQQSYKNALLHYLKQDYKLVLLGDVEEFWENTIPKVMAQYKNIQNLEKKFYEKEKLIKIWGNHDDEWQYNSTIKKYLSNLFKNITCVEGINLKCVWAEKHIGDILLVHGHQGTLASDRWSWISKFVIRYGWRNIQRIFHIPLSTPRKDKGLKSEHDLAFYQWAANKNKQVVICGHTHQPVFTSKTHIDKLNEQMNRSTNSFEKKKIKNQIDLLKAEGTSLAEHIEKTKPCYFNTGCCSFSDGDITGIEINNGQIALVKWNVEGRKILENQSVLEIFKA